MMHWKTTLSVLGLFLGTLALSGCSQPCCLPDYDQFTQRAGLPCDLASNPYLSDHPLTPPIKAPQTVNDLNNEPYYITLKECIASALERGNVGTQSFTRYVSGNTNLNNLFNTTEELSQFQNGVGAVGFDSIRVFALQPAITFTDLETSLARYDVVLRSILGFNTADQNPLGPNGFRVGQFTAAGVSMEKGLPTGGLAGITFGSPTNAGSNPGTNIYSNFGTRNFITGSVNPSYTPNLSLTYTQPLLRGFGTYVNSLLQQHPLSPAAQVPGSPIGAAPAIVIARINFDQSRAEFERVVNYMVLNVEASYFQLYALYVNLYSTEQALRQSHMAWKISKAKYEAGSVAITGFAQTRAQYEDFRAQRIIALDKVLEQERELRLLIGLPVEDGKRLVPVDTPTVDPYVPDWNTAQQEALALRPELAIARQDIKRRQLELVEKRNNLLPTLNFEASYNVRGFGTRLDGNGTFANGQTNNALHDLASTHFSDYNLGFVGSMPLGFRAQNASERAARLRLAQAYYLLRDMENRATSNLTLAYRAIIKEYEVIIARRSQREAAAEQVEARFKEFIAGKSTVDFLLEAQRQWAAALAQEYQSIVNYNIDLAGFQFAKGTLLAHNGIQIAEGPLPQCIQVRAVENERQRAHAIACLEHAAVVAEPAFGCLPNLPGANAPSLPALMMDQKERVPLSHADEGHAPNSKAGNAALSNAPGLPGAQWPAKSALSGVTTEKGTPLVNVTGSPTTSSAPTTKVPVTSSVPTGPIFEPAKVSSSPTGPSFAPAAAMNSSLSPSLAPVPPPSPALTPVPPPSQLQLSLPTTPDVLPTPTGGWVAPRPTQAELPLLPPGVR